MLFRSRNYAIQQSKGLYILPLDADDRLHFTFLEKTVHILKLDNSIAFVGTYFQHFGLSTFQGTYGLSGDSNLYIKADPNTLVTCLFKYSDWDLVGGYDESMTLGLEDWDFWIRLLEATKKTVYVIPEILFDYRIKKKSTSTYVNANKDEMVKLLINRHPDLYRNNFVEAIVDREKKLIEVWGYVKEDSKRIQSLQKTTEQLAAKVLATHFSTISINSTILIYGMSNVTELLLPILKDKNLQVKAVIDQAAVNRNGLFFHNIPVISLFQAFQAFHNITIIITSIQNYHFLYTLITEQLTLYPTEITAITLDGILILKPPTNTMQA